MNSTLFKPKAKTLVSFLSLGIIVYSFIIIIPLVMSLRYSFFNWSGGPNMKFVGINNYIELIKDMDFWLSFKNNVIIIVLCVIGQIGTALILTSLMMSKLLKFKEFYRTTIFIPVVISTVVVGFIWNLIYSKDFGLLNWLLNSLNLKALIKPWLDDPDIVLYSVTAPLVWQFIGLYLIIFMSAIQGISKEIFEVAELDGATGIKKAIYITIPMLKDVIKVTIMLCIAGNMKVFDSIYVMTGGGPGKSSMVMAQYAYNNSFTMFKLGYGSTISIGILILSFSFIFISRKLMGGNKDD
ncbi:carbohydrate ABC transporter permease [Clostridium lacusfryxellense]|uniref:carbohydrate ABC transporter permease n=1 Tax=Clostridium lacusfryxellense TaxID=205328 RepID=UPI001FEC9636|nr:sugar ABC transporter permease [Clostridium lacusfryxellense]